MNRFITCVCRSVKVGLQRNGFHAAKRARGGHSVGQTIASNMIVALTLKPRVKFRQIVVSDRHGSVPIRHAAVRTLNVRPGQQLNKEYWRCTGKFFQRCLFYCSAATFRRRRRPNCDSAAHATRSIIWAASATQADAAAASGATIIYTGGLGEAGYLGLPPQSQLDQLCRNEGAYIHRAKSAGIELAIGYLCATSIVDLKTFDKNWTPEFRSQFKTPPAEWRQQDRHGKPLPSWYGGATRRPA